MRSLPPSAAARATKELPPATYVKDACCPLSSWRIASGGATSRSSASSCVAVRACLVTGRATFAMSSFATSSAARRSALAPLLTRAERNLSS
jgi:hypothetical protein